MFSISLFSKLVMESMRFLLTKTQPNLDSPIPFLQQPQLTLPYLRRFNLGTYREYFQFFNYKIKIKIKIRATEAMLAKKALSRFEIVEGCPVVW